MSATPNTPAGQDSRRRPHPWGERSIAELYDLFPFEADLPFYLDLAAGHGGKVLELACGTGRVLVPLASSGARVTGIDASPHMLEIAGQKVAAAGGEVAGRAQLVQADLTDFSLEDRFDVAIVAVKSFAYLTERSQQQAALKRIAAHLRTGGVLALDLLSPSLEWLSQVPGSVRQDLMGRTPDGGTITRTETAVATDRARQIRVIRSVYDVVDDAGRLSRQVVEWPFRYTFRFEAELLLERSGFEIDAVYGGYDREPYDGSTDVMLFVARRP